LQEPASNTEAARKLIEAAVQAELDGLYREEADFVNPWGVKKALLRGPKRETADGIANYIRQKELAGPGPRGMHYEEALMRAMAGQPIAAELNDNLTDAQKKDLVRQHYFMAMGPVWTKANQVTASKKLLEDVGGSPGANWDQVIRLQVFHGDVVRLLTMEPRRRWLLHTEAVGFVRRFQAAVQGLSIDERPVETEGAVRASWEEFKVNARGHGGRTAAVGAEVTAAVVAANAGVVVEEEPRGVVRRGADLVAEPFKRVKRALFGGE